MLTCHYLDPRWFAPVNRSAIPVYVTATDLCRVRRNSPTLLAAIAATLQDRLGSIDLTTLELAAKAAHIVFVVDGWDGIHAAKDAEELFHECLDSIGNYSRLGSFVFGGRNRFFTARDVAAAIEARSITTIECRGFDRRDQEKWLEKYEKLC